MTETALFYGTKRIQAQPMTRAKYNEYRGWDVPKDEDGADEGYLVEYEGDRPNHPAHKGYISWSPKDVFEASYQPTGKMNFGHALAAMFDGHKVGRAGWNGKGMWICLGQGGVQTAENFWNKHTRAFAESIPERRAEVLPYFIMKTADDKILMGWLASQSDMVATDWEILP